MEIQWQALLAVAGAVAFCVAWPVLAAAVRLKRLRLRDPLSREIARSQVPERETQVLDGARELLAGLGFTYDSTTVTDAVLDVEGAAPLYSDCYRHRDGLGFAQVAPAALPELEDPFHVSFSTLLQDGTLHVTVDCQAHEMIGWPPGCRIHDDYLGGTAAAWRAHQQRLRSAAIVNDPQAFAQATRAATEQAVAHLVGEGRLVRVGGAARLTWRQALVYAWQLLRGQRRAARVRQSHRTAQGHAGQPMPAPSATRLQAELHAFGQQLALRRGGQLSQARKWAWFLVSAAAFLAVGALWMKWTIVVALLVVIGLHEGGHYLAMKAAGYRNLSVFFLPGLGGLATGHKASAGPWEKLLVYLAGPAPGLLVALAGLAAMASGAWQPPSWFFEFLVACLVVNYLNLLPVTPLDGGRIVETLLFARLPAARLAFVLACLAALLWYAVAARDYAIVGVAVFIALTLPHQWRVMRVDRALPRQQDETLDEKQAVERIFETLQRPEFTRWSFAVRAATAAALLPELQGRRARAGEAVAGLAIYVAVLVVPLVAATLSFPEQTASVRQMLAQAFRREPSQPQQRDPDWYAEADRVEGRPEPERLGVLLKALEQASDMEDDERIARYLEAAWTLAEQRPPRDAERTRTMLARARESRDDTVREARLREIVAEHEGVDDRDSALALAEAYQIRSWHAEGAARIAALRLVLEHRERAHRPSVYEVVMARKMLARELDEAGQAGEAESLLRRNVEVAPEPGRKKLTCGSGESSPDRHEAQHELAWFLLAHDRAPEAGALLEQAVLDLPAEPATSRWDAQVRVRQALLWARVDQARPAAVGPAWDAYERSLARVRKDETYQLLHDIDHVIVAEAMGDRPRAQRAREAVSDAAGTRRAKGARHQLCGDASGAPGYWDTWREKMWSRRSRVAHELRLCEGS